MTSNNYFAPTQGATEATPVALSRTVARKAKVIVFFLLEKLKIGNEFFILFFFHFFSRR